MRRQESDALIDKVAPVMPPCFAKRRAWLDVLKAAQADPGCPPENRPLTPDGEFNFHGVVWCTGCTPEYRIDQGHLCRPDWFHDEGDGK